MMTRRPLSLALLTAVILLIGLNLAIEARSHRLPVYRRLEAIRTSPDPNLLIVGNSLLEHSFDETAFVQAAPDAHFRPLNSALSSTSPPEQLLLFDYATSVHPGIRDLVVGVFDFQLTVPDHSRLADLAGNHSVGIDPRYPVSEVAEVYGFGKLERLEIQAARALPMIAYRSNVWMYVELLRRSMGEIGMPHSVTNSMGRADDFAALEADSVKIFDTQAKSFIDHPVNFNTSFESMFGQAQRGGIGIVIVVMPMSPYHRQRFYSRALWHQYLAAVADLARQRGIRVIDASDWMLPEQDFVDHLHMTHEAGSNFSARLGSVLAKPH
jgi:hypothetical protein